MSNMCMAKIKACLLMSAQSRFFSNTSPVHPSSLQPLSCSFIHPPSHVPISSNIHVRHVTEVHAAGEGQLHHSSLLVGCQGGIKPTANVCWKSERFGGKHSTSWSWDICHDIHRTFVTLNIYICYHQGHQILRYEHGTTNAAATAGRKKLHHLRCSKPCTFPLSSVGDTYQFGLRVF